MMVGAMTVTCPSCGDLETFVVHITGEIDCPNCGTRLSTPEGPTINLGAVVKRRFVGREYSKAELEDMIREEFNRK